jgi:hypothetical protein
MFLGPKLMEPKVLGKPFFFFKKKKEKKRKRKKEEAECIVATI